jgi:predicted nucleic acid-binding Zn ribbon protein
MMLVAERYCLNCNAAIDPLKGRKDRKYCDDRCRSSYHNLLSEQLRSETARINNILATNMTIMKSLLGDKTSVRASIEVMKRKGFSFDYITQVHKDYKFCYSYGYAPKDEKYCLIVKGFKDIVEKE